MELFNEPIIQKKTLSDVIKNDNVITNSTMVGGSFNGGKITIGSGENIFTANKDGIFLGSSSFSTAPFRVDMAGNMTASSATISGDLISSNYNEGAGTGYKLEYTTGKAYFGGAVITGDSIIGNYGVSANAIGKAINNDGNLIGDIINYKLDTFNREILDEFTFQGSGGIAITYDYYSGVWLSPSGIIGKKYGNTTFGISASGDAVFGGTLVAASGTFGTVTAGTLSGVGISSSTITGGIVQTATSGNRIVMNGLTNKIEFKNGNTLYAQMSPYAGGSASGFEIATHGDYTGPASLILYEGASSLTASLTATNINLNGTTYLNGTTVNSGNIAPATTNTYSLGTSSYRFSDVHTNAITLNGVQRTSWPTAFSGNLSDLSINTAKNWGGYNITNLGSLIPGFGTTTLGNSSFYWSSLYIGNIYGAFGYNVININSVVDMNNQPIRDVANPTNAQDVATKAWVEANFAPL